MKKYTVGLGVLLAMALASCSKNTKMEKLLERKWKVESLNSKDIEEGIVVLRQMADTT